MPWPERDLTTRFLAGAVGAILGALLGFILVAVWLRYFTLWSPTRIVVYAAGAGALLGFLLGFLIGDPAVRFLGRLV